MTEQHTSGRVSESRCHWRRPRSGGKGEGEGKGEGKGEGERGRDVEWEREERERDRTRTEGGIHVAEGRGTYSTCTVHM